jgi:hypothetical protein
MALRHERGFPGQVHGVRIGRKIVVEGDVFLKHNDQVLDRSRGAGLAEATIDIAAVMIIGKSTGSRDQ